MLFAVQVWSAVVLCVPRALGPGAGHGRGQSAASEGGARRGHCVPLGTCVLLTGSTRWGQGAPVERALATRLIECNLTRFSAANQDFVAGKNFFEIWKFYYKTKTLLLEIIFKKTERRERVKPCSVVLTPRGPTL